MDCSEAYSYLQILKSHKTRLEKMQKIDPTLESKLGDLLQIDRFYDAINCFSEQGDFIKITEAYQIASDICTLAATKSQNEEFSKRTEKLALLFRDKIPIEEAATSLRSALVPRVRSISVRNGIDARVWKLDDFAMKGPHFDSIIAEKARRQHEPLEELPYRSVQRARVSDLSGIIKGELAEIVGPAKGKALSKLLSNILRQQNLPVKIEHKLKVLIGPNIATFRPDIAIFDSSNNLKTIVETVSKLSQRKAEDLSLRLLAMKKDYPKVSLFVLFIEATPKAIEFMKPIVDGVYSIEDIAVFLEKIRT